MYIIRMYIIRMYIKGVGTYRKKNKHLKMYLYLEHIYSWRIVVHTRTHNEAPTHTHIRTVCVAHTHTHIYIYIYLFKTNIILYIYYKIVNNSCNNIIHSYSPCIQCSHCMVDNVYTMYETVYSVDYIVYTVYTLRIPIGGGYICTHAFNIHEYTHVFT